MDLRNLREYRDGLRSLGNEPVNGKTTASVLDDIIALLAAHAAEPAAPPAVAEPVMTAVEQRSPAGRAFISWIASWTDTFQFDLPSPAAYRWSGFAAGWNAALATARPTAPQAVTDEMVERAAEAMWQEESLRATHKPRRIAWADEGDDTKEKWRGLARVALSARQEGG